eukprot:6469790-Amphidinium_carterae.2
MEPESIQFEPQGMKRKYLDPCTAPQSLSGSDNLSGAFALSRCSHALLVGDVSELNSEQAVGYSNAWVL